VVILVLRTSGDGRREEQKFLKSIDFKNFCSSLLPSPEVLKVQLKFNSTGFVKEPVFLEEGRLIFL